MAKVPVKITRAAHREVARVIREAVVSFEYDVAPKGMSQAEWERTVDEIARIADNHELIGKEP
jgi:hypothetical protein